MDQGPLVDYQIKDGARIVDALRASGFDVTVAWWMKSGEEGLWHLYIASKEVDANGHMSAYGPVQLAMRDLEDLWVDRSEVRLVEPDHRIAKAILAILTKFPVRVPTRVGGTMLGGQFVQDAYAYPLPVTV